MLSYPRDGYTTVAPHTALTKLKYEKKKENSSERFSFECRENKTKAVTMANHNKRKQCNEPIRELKPDARNRR